MCITDLDAGDVTMLRYWFSERAHWLADDERQLRDTRGLDRLLGR